MAPRPETIGRYRIDGVLGGGAMGVIYRAYDPEIDRNVAIKLIRADLLSGDERENYIQRFRREAQAAGRCVHPNIVTVYDFALHDGNPYLTMELVEGQSLGEARARGTSFTPDEAIVIMLQVLEALAAAHKSGIVHRDIKPANILLDHGRNIVKVTDFGISRISSSELTGAGLMIGTPSYMSPEQCRGLKVDARSDLFSAAAVLYELLAGERPFAADHPTAVMHRLLNETPRDLGILNPALHPELRTVVIRGLAKAPDDRYGSAAEMAAALRAVPSADTAATVINDRTVVMPKPRREHAVASADITRGAATRGGSFPGSGAYDPATLATIERKLAAHLGPIARVVLKGALKPGETPEKIADSLAAAIPDTEARGRFRAETLASLRADASIQTAAAPVASAVPLTPTVIPQAELDRAEKELVRYLGPIARVLVRRKAAEARSAKQLWELLAAHIDQADQRSAFLRRAPA
jgi:eukaryotic-like serine/threonine-protein kinase